MKTTNDHWIDREYQNKFLDFQNLMRYRIRNVLLVSSLYDSYIIEEDARLYELIRTDYEGFNISHVPDVRRVSSGKEALQLVLGEQRFDLVITTLHIEDTHPLELVKQIRDSGSSVPVVLLALDQKELAELLSHYDTSLFDRIFLWQGDVHLITSILHDIEDRKNVEHDTKVGGVQSILLIEDNIRFYSSFLPNIYTEVLKHSQRLISEGVNLSHRFLRMRARPKILLSTSYDEAWNYFTKYGEHISGIISDVDFLRDGKPDTEAGIEFTRNIKKLHPDIPVLIQSNLTENQSKAKAAGASFVMKDSPSLLQDVRLFMKQYFGFGDFVFRMPNGTEVGRATDLKSLEKFLSEVPLECILYHSERNHFSNWLKARTEFGLAFRLRPRQVSDYPSLEALRQDLISSLHSYREEQQRGRITDFTKETYDPASSFARIGGGSLGGKARGLGFVNMLLNTSDVVEKFPGVRLFIPPGVVIGTDVFDWFMEKNRLRNIVLTSKTDDETARFFLRAKKFPRKVIRELKSFLELVHEPLAVRSSSLQEDSQYQPFAGIFATYMIPNNHLNPAVRLRELLNAIRRVYASTYSLAAREYTRHTIYRLEEEKMAVIIQQVVGTDHHNRFYPECSGVAKSFNFYPMPPQLATDGIASVALGLGKMIVDGGVSVTFCPKYPEHSFQFSTVENMLANNQSDFFAVDLSVSRSKIDSGDLTKSFTLEHAEQDGTLNVLGSVYSQENETVYDGLSRQGMRLVTFAPMLKNKLFPLAEIIDELLEIGSSGMGTPVEIEFAVNLSVPNSQQKEFGVLQLRPLVVSREVEELRLEKIDRSSIICESQHVLGNGIVDGIEDIVFVNTQTFDRAKTRDVAHEVIHFNASLSAEKRPYVLIGVGRWGTLDPWLGIPVRWEHISGAKVIVEAGFTDITVEPSQGSHFFQNLISFMIGYFTVSEQEHQGFVDWQWLLQQKIFEEKHFTRHVRLSSPLVIKMNGHQQSGVILKPK